MDEVRGQLGQFKLPLLALPYTDTQMRSSIDRAFFDRDSHHAPQCFLARLGAEPPSYRL